MLVTLTLFENNNRHYNTYFYTFNLTGMAQITFNLTIGFDYGVTTVLKLHTYCDTGNFGTVATLCQIAHQESIIFTIHFVAEQCSCCMWSGFHHLLQNATRWHGVLFVLYVVRDTYM